MREPASDSRPRVARIKPGAALSVVQHEPMLSFLLGYVDGKRDSAALAQELALEVETIERMLGELCRHGVIELAAVELEPDAGKQQPMAAHALKANAQSARMSMLPPPDSSPALPPLSFGSAPLSAATHAAERAAAARAEAQSANAQAARAASPRAQNEASPSQPPTTVHRGKNKLSRAPSTNAASAARPSRAPAPDLRASAEAARVAAASSARSSRPPAVDLTGAADTARITVGGSVRASRASSANSASASEAARVAATSSARPSRAPSADMRAAAEAARVAAASSMRPSQAPTSGRAGPSQPPASGRREGVQSSRPTARPAANDAPLGAAAQVLAQAEAAFHAGHAPEAIRHLKLLQAMTFDDVRVQKRANELREQVLRIAAFDLEKQAIHEERQQHWQRAAKSWLQVAEGRPIDSLPLQRAALAQLQGGVELRSVVETARRAVQVAPNDAQAHRILARVYSAADMQASAARELEAAKRCGPSHEPSEEATPTGLLKRLLGRDGPG